MYPTAARQERDKVGGMPVLHIPWSTDYGLAQMLTTKRPHGSDMEQRFINHFIDPLDAVQDAFGNRYVTVNLPGDQPPTIMFSCHTDTVHRQPGTQRLHLSRHKQIWLDDKGSNCLGADDGTGVWIMREMILAAIPGLYVFHRAEELGCRGSKWAVENNAKKFTGITHCIAFDRKGQGDVVTHQMGQRGCSDSCADSLAAALGGDYQPDKTGVFTDSAEYFDLIPECINLSVGYANQHGPDESQCADFARSLLDKCLKLDWHDLPIDRDPAAGPEYDDWDVDYGYGGYGGFAYGYNGGPKYWQNYNRAAASSRTSEGYDELAQLVTDYPEAALELLWEYGVSVDELAERAAEIYGGIVTSNH